MKIFANKKIWKKMLFAIGLIAFIGLVLPKQVNAGIGGTLITPIVDLFTGLADGVQTLIHKIFVKQDVVLYLISEGINWWGVAIGLLIGIVLVATGVITIQLAITVAAITLVLSIAGVQDVVFNTVKTISADMLTDKTIVLPTFTLTPYEIFTSEEGVFSVNFFREEEEKKNDDKNITLSLNQNIRDWYKTLRLIALVGMMSVLIYIGIRILLSSTGESKAKYKQMLWDWLVATFLIFTMQYIMIFANIMVDTLTDTLGTIKVETEVIKNDTKEKIKTHINKEGVEGYIIGVKQNEDGGPLEIDSSTTDLVKKAYKQLVKSDNGNPQSEFKKYFYSDPNLLNPAGDDEGKANVLFWPADNFATQARMNAQLIRNPKGNDTSEYIGYAMVYVALTIYTVIFILVYIKRYIYMVFLTLISPLVALTYPIDKVKDGQAQAFNFWFKEYLYNLLLQPLHLILYMLLIGSAMRFAASDPLYVIVCLGFMVPAEKLLKAMFGFKGQTPGSMPGVATAALMMNVTKRLFEKSPKSGGNNGTSSKGDDQELKPIQTRTRDLLLGDDSTGVNPQPVNPQPVNPQPVNPQLVNPQPVNPQPVSPQPVNPQPVNPQPVNPQPVNPQPVNPQPVNPQPVNPPPVNPTGRRKRVPRPIRNAVRTGGKFAGKIAKDGIRTVGKVGTGLAIGAIGATAGGIAGLVSGDPSKAFENILTGGVAGYTVGARTGEGIGEGAVSLVDAGINKLDDWRFNKNSDKYKDRYNKKFTDDYIKNKDKMRVLRRNKRSKEQFQDLIKDGGFLEEYHKAGFTDEREIAAMEQYRMTLDNSDEIHKRQALEQAMSIQKTYEYFYKGMSGSGENSDKFRASLANKIQKQHPNYSPAQINTAIDNTMNLMKTYDDIKFKIF